MTVGFQPILVERSQDAWGVSHARVIVGIGVPALLFCWMSGWNEERVVEYSVRKWCFPVTCMFCMRGFLCARRV